MRSLVATVFVGLGSSAFAQVPVMQSLPGGTPVGTAYAPKPVGSPVGSPVGTRLPPLGKPPAGAVNPTIGNFTPPKNGSPDPSTVIAPYPTSMKPADKSFWDQVYDRWLGIFTTNTPPPQKTYTPGIARRARERDEKRFARD